MQTTKPILEKNMNALTEDATIKAMVDRFLTWKLPESFNPDGGICFTHKGLETWPIGTNLFTATEARQMLEHVLGDTLTSLRSSRDEADKKLAFLKSKGITVGYMKTSDRPEPYLVYVIALGSELDELPTVNKLIEAQVALAESGAKMARMEAGHRESERQFAAKCDEIGKLMDDLSAARAEVSRLSGELASRPAKELDIRLEPQQQRVIDNLRNWYKTSALSQASSADALSAPAKDAHERGKNERDAARYRWMRDEGLRYIKWEGFTTNTCDIGLDHAIDTAIYAAKTPDAFSPAPVAGERLCEFCQCPLKAGLSVEYKPGKFAHVECNQEHHEAVLAENSRDEAAPASAVSPASEEKDAKVYFNDEYRDTRCPVVEIDGKRFFVDDHELNSTFFGCIPDEYKIMPEPRRTEILTAFWPLYEKWKAEQVSPTPAPAPSEDYPGVRVWKTMRGFHRIEDTNLKRLHHLDTFMVQKSTRESPAPGDTELHGPERLAVIEKAVRLRSDLFGKQESPTTEEDNIRRIVRDELARHGMVLK